MSHDSEPQPAAGPEPYTLVDTIPNDDGFTQTYLYCGRFVNLHIQMPNNDNTQEVDNYE